MKYLLSVVAALLFCCSVAIADTPFTVVKLSKSAGELKSQMLAQQQQSEKLHQKIFVQLTADWCIHCRKLNASLANKKMKDAFQRTYIVQLDVDEWKDQLGSIDVHPNGIPAFYQIGENGLATNYTINGGAWGEDMVANMAPPLKNYFTHAR